jgi:hypothetical protein
VFFVLAPFYRALGATGVLAGAGLVNLGAVLASLLVAYRRGGPRVVVLVALMLALLVRGVGTERLIDPWNPWLAFLPFVLFLLLVWSVTCGDLPLLPWAVVVGSFSIQSHVVYLPLVVGLLGLALATVVVKWWRRPHERSPPTLARNRAPGRWLAIAAGVALLLWAPALVQQAFGHPANLGALFHYLRAPQEPTTGWRFVARLFGQQLQPRGTLLTGAEKDDYLGYARTASLLPAVLVVGTAAALGWRGWRQGERDEVRLVCVALVGVALGLAASSRITGAPFPYVFHWWRGIAALVWLSIAMRLVTEAVRWRKQMAEGATVLALAATAIAAGMTMTGLPADLPVRQVSVAIEAVSDATVSALDPCLRYLVDGFDSALFEAAPSGLYLELARRGLQVFAMPGPAAELKYGRWRLATRDEVDGVVTIVALADLGVTWQPPAEARRVAEWDPLTEAQRRRARELQSRVRRAEQLTASDAAELRTLQRPGDGYAVYLSAAQGGSVVAEGTDYSCRSQRGRPSAPAV